MSKEPDERFTAVVKSFPKGGKPEREEVLSLKDEDLLSGRLNNTLGPVIFEEQQPPIFSGMKNEMLTNLQQKTMRNTAGAFTADHKAELLIDSKGMPASVRQMSGFPGQSSSPTLINKPQTYYELN